MPQETRLVHSLRPQHAASRCSVAWTRAGNGRDWLQRSCSHRACLCPPIQRQGWCQVKANKQTTLVDRSADACLVERGF